MAWSDLVTAYLSHDHSSTGRFRGQTIAGSHTSGVIVLWAGSIATIPSGWLLCNGASGTPDLRNKFVRGAGGVYTESSTGGVDTHNFVHSHSASATIAAGGSHFHNSNSSSSNLGGTERLTDTNHDGGLDQHTHAALSSSTDGSHAHTASASTDSQLGAVDNRPVFYTLAYIMKS